MEERDYSILTRVLFGLDTPTPMPRETRGYEPEFRDTVFVDETLNDSQKDAIRFALASREIVLIHGPPGVCPFQHQIHVTPSNVI